MSSKIKIKRWLEAQILKDLQEKLVFLVGPRQVGKTWLSREIMKKYKNPLYLNYDNVAHKAAILKYNWLPENDLIVFDEIHKMKGWKNYLKGVYDTRHSGLHILVTGSARLNAHRNMGDSMAGRFYVQHLFPFTLQEFKRQKMISEVDPLLPAKLLNRGGFPDPFTNESLEISRWQNFYADSLLREDVLSLESIENLNALRSIYDILKTKVGSPVSYSNIAGDLGISPITVKKYISLLEALYVIFIIRPFSKKISRSILREPKVYFYDYTLVSDVGSRFENFVALSLLAQAQEKEDITGKKIKLHFLKTKDGQEVDFAYVSEKQEVIKIFEAKYSDEGVGNSLKYFTEKYSYKAVQVVYNNKLERMAGENIEIRGVNYLENNLL
jgi:hypothetical protein